MEIQTNRGVSLTSVRGENYCEVDYQADYEGGEAPRHDIEKGGSLSRLRRVVLRAVAPG
jgi:hypothetical protein